MRRSIIISSNIEVIRQIIQYLPRENLSVYPDTKQRLYSLFILPEEHINIGETIYRQLNSSAGEIIILTSEVDFFASKLVGEIKIITPDPCYKSLKVINPRHKTFFQGNCLWYSLEDFILLPFKPWSNKLVISYSSNSIQRLNYQDSNLLLYQCVRLNRLRSSCDQKLSILTCTSVIFMKYIMLRVIFPKEPKGDRGPSHSKKSLSRSPYYWKLTFAKWKKYTCHFLRRSTWKKLTEVQNFRYWLPLSGNGTAWKKVFFNDSNKRVDT